MERIPLVNLPVDQPVASPTFGQPKRGIGLCLSGGGYRAMLFHLGVLWRLNELGYLAKIDRVSSVSGGSIAAGVLAVNWTSLRFDTNGVAQSLQELVVNPLKGLSGKTIDLWAITRGTFGPGLPYSLFWQPSPAVQAARLVCT